MLLECDWGVIIRTEADPGPCMGQAVQFICLHHTPPDGDETIVRLCARHRDLVLAETQPSGGSHPVEATP